MATKSWLKKISALKNLIQQVGALWPESTKLAGYAERGPYHCQNCEYLKGQKDGNIFKDDTGRGRCNQPVMISDPQVQHDKSGLAIVNIERGCCEFVEPPGEDESSIEGE